jgi:putative modified peptide
MNGEETYLEIKMSPQQADELVDRLVNDTEFRERLTQNPIEELAHYGISVSPALLPERIELPSPEELRQALNAIETGELGGYENYIWFRPFWFLTIWFIKLRRRS